MLIPKTQFIRSESHRRFVANFCCIACDPGDFFEALDLGSWGPLRNQQAWVSAHLENPAISQAAHMRHLATCGMGIKPSDEWTLPLCTVDKMGHHEAHDADPKAFWDKWLRDQVCMRLAKLSPDEKIRSVV